MAGFNKLSGLWETKDKNGNIYWRGKGEDGRMYYMMPNKNKKNDKYPDMELSYQVFDDDNTKPDKTQAPQGVKPVEPVAPEVDDDTNVPF